LAFRFFSRGGPAEVRGVPPSRDAIISSGFFRRRRLAMRMTAGRTYFQLPNKLDGTVPVTDATTRRRVD
jgi:hypothetical protein